MKAWFLQLTRREQLILTSGIGIAVLCLVWMLLVPALRTSHADARQSLADAIEADELALAGAGASLSGRARPQLAGMPAARQRQVMIDAAANRGLTVSRLQAPDSASILFQFEKVPSPALFAWLEDLERQLGQEPTRATIEAAEAGGVRASVEFRLEGGA
ncbi:MAG: type II secretion system protein GspM [Hyphomonas sp.]